MKHFTFKPMSPKGLHEYFQMKDQQAPHDYYSLVILLVLYVIVTGILQAIEKVDAGLYVAIGCIIGLILLIFLFKISRWIRRYGSFIVLAIMLGFIFCRLNMFSVKFAESSKGQIFFRGSALACLEILIIIRFRYFIHQVMGIILTFIAKLVILGIYDPETYNVGTILRLIVMDLFVLYTFYAIESRHRATFFNYYHNKEGLMNFKELLSDYLPQSVAVISSELTGVLFANRYFLDTFGDLKAEMTNETYLMSEGDHRVASLAFLKFLKVEKETLREMESKERCSFSMGNDQLTLNDVVRRLKKADCLESAWILSVSFAGAGSACNSSSKLFEVILKKIKWDGQNALAVIFNDITYQQNIIALKLADSNKNKILATVSHDLRTPLNAITGILEICEKKIENQPDVLEYLNLCKDNAHLLISLVNSLLDLQQLSQGKLRVNPAQIDLRKLVSNVIRLFDFQAKSKGITLSCDIDDNVPYHITTDENRLKQIFINLLGNALKFTFEGGITISVREDAAYPDCLKITVKDTGVGIKEEDIGKLFTMFGKLEDKEGVNKNGIGLGLTIASALSSALGIEIEGRAIQLESQVGVGTSFIFRIKKTLTIPLATEEMSPSFTPKKKQMKKFEEEEESLYLKDFDESKTPSAKVHKIYISPSVDNTLCLVSQRQQSAGIGDINLLISKSNSGSMTGLLDSQRQEKFKDLESDGFLLRPRRHKSIKTSAFTNRGSQRNQIVMVVDDNPFNLLVAKNILKDLGYQSMAVSSGKEAIELVKKSAETGQVPKAIFMDCQMPIMDGFEASQILRSLMSEKEIPNIPIVAFTANTSERDIERCYESGMVDYLSKPLLIQNMRTVLNKL